MQKKKSGKAAKARSEFIEYRAIHRYAQISAQKVRVFADLIRGKNAEEAMTLLGCYPNRGARFLEQVLKSAMANAEDRKCQNIDGLRVAKVFVDGGPMQRRWRAGSRGVSVIIRRRSSHINVVLDAGEANPNYNVQD